MKQLALLTIEPPAIREVVLDRLQGFKYRQQAREAKRAQKNAKQRVRRGKRENDSLSH